MKLVEALEIVNAPESGAAFQVLLACGFTSVHLETAVKAHLRLRLPDRTIRVRPGLYGDLSGTLESVEERLDAVVIALEWSDIDPRLGWRTMGAADDTLPADAQARLERLASAVGALAQHTPVALALPGLPIAPVFHSVTGELSAVESRLREMLYRFAAGTAAAVVHPDSLPRAGHDLRTELLNGSPYTFAYTDALAAQLVRAALPAAPKKGLITDLDETLWSGVLGDDGPDGVSWDLDRKTQFHALYQHLLNSLAEAGTLIGVASKNDEALVRKVFERRDLVLAPARVFGIEAHWNAKSESIARLLETWNIGADSVVFVDDNALEIEQIKAAWPAIECLTFRRDDASFLRQLGDLFGKRTVTEEDRLRAASLRDGHALRRAAADPAILENLLAGAQARLAVRWDRQTRDPRALELVNKTNQFNLNGRRFTESDWNALLADEAAHLVVAEYEDRFGKLGKIAVLAGREEDEDFHLLTWVMSCRAFSRRIEHQCLKLLLKRWPRVMLDFQPTERNGPLQCFLAQMGADCGVIEAPAFESRCPRLFHEVEILNA